jgi:type IX secretion system substrate protein
LEFKSDNMNAKKQKWGLVILLLLVVGNVCAQEAISTTGGNASGNGGSMSYTIGQTTYSYASNGGSVTQGVQQSYIISTVLGTENKAVNLQVTVFPNPTINYLTLSVEDVSASNGLNFILYDMQGNLLVTKNIIEANTTIEMAEFRSAIYYLKVEDREQTVKTFKIIKN